MFDSMILESTEQRKRVVEVAAVLSSMGVIARGGQALNLQQQIDGHPAVVLANQHLRVSEVELRKAKFGVHFPDGSRYATHKESLAVIAGRTAREIKTNLEWTGQDATIPPSSPFAYLNICRPLLTSAAESLDVVSGTRNGPRQLGAVANAIYSMDTCEQKLLDLVPPELYAARNGGLIDAVGGLLVIGTLLLARWRLSRMNSRTKPRR